jgi:hypothetical protein
VIIGKKEAGIGIGLYCALGVLGRWEWEWPIWKDRRVLWNPTDCIMYGIELAIVRLILGIQPGTNHLEEGKGNDENSSIRVNV